MCKMSLWNRRSGETEGSISRFNETSQDWWRPHQTCNIQHRACTYMRLFVCEMGFLFCSHTFVVWGNSLCTVDLTRNVTAGEGIGQVNINPDKSTMAAWNFDRITKIKYTWQHNMKYNPMGIGSTETHNWSNTSVLTSQTHTQNTKVSISHLYCVVCYSMIIVMLCNCSLDLA